MRSAIQTTTDNSRPMTFALGHSMRFCGLALCTALIAMALVGARKAAATTISDAGTVVQNTIPGGGLATDGYIFYDPIVHPSSGPGSTLTPTNVASPLPSYVAAITPIATTYYNAPSGTYSALTIASTLYDTGAIYALGNLVSHNLLSITLQSSGLPTNVVQIGLLGDNENGVGADRNQSFTVSSLSGNSITETPIGSDQTNRFYLFNLTGLTPGDTITVSGVAGNFGILLGGLTFATVPEPSSVVLLAISIGGLLCVARRRCRTNMKSL